MGNLCFHCMKFLCEVPISRTALGCKSYLLQKWLPNGPAVLGLTLDCFRQLYIDNNDNVITPLSSL